MDSTQAIARATRIPAHLIFLGQLELAVPGPLLGQGYSRMVTWGRDMGLAFEGPSEPESRVRLAGLGAVCCQAVRLSGCGTTSRWFDLRLSFLTGEMAMTPSLGCLWSILSEVTR